MELCQPNHMCRPCFLGSEVKRNTKHKNVGSSCFLRLVVLLVQGRSCVFCCLAYWAVEYFSTRGVCV